MAGMRLFNITQSTNNTLKYSIVQNKMEAAALFDNIQNLKLK